MEHKLFGKGHDGIIIYPAISTNNINDINEYVTKIGFEKHLKNEKYVYDNLPDKFINKIYNKECYIDQFNSNDTLLDNDILEILQRKGVNYDTQLTMKKIDGLNLYVILNKKTNISKEQTYNLLKKMIMLYECLNILNNKYNIYHKDITRHNIMFNLATNEIRIIDFVQAKIYPDNKKPSHMPNKDLTDTIDVINSILEFIKKKMKYNIDLNPIQNISDIKQKMPFIKKTLSI
jgi:serine/threonine protein kinase